MTSFFNGSDLHFDFSGMWQSEIGSMAIRKRSQAKPSQSANWGAETCAKRKSKYPCLLAIPAFDRIAGLYNRHLNSKRGTCLR
jgi:hypothetical protein